jgi:hypothetical protein
MVCKDFIFKLTSGQLALSGLKDQFIAYVHTFICSNCRHFKRNDRIIGRYIANYREEIESLKNN